jgi:NAD(P)-dependent dehydrogenase (short-subunit alcohol dehydrogenase family)/acyl carrier protein
VDHEGALLPEDHIGRLQVAGSTVMTGYHRNEDANRASFTDDGWFNTGDLGFLHHGSLTITGRENDLIIIQGANYLSYDIESIVERVPGTEVTFVAACAVTDPGSATDELAVFFVPTSAWVDDQRVTAGEIRARLSREIGLQPHRVIPVPRERFPKTSSGKIQRAQLVADLRAGAFDEILRELDTAGEADAGWLFERVWLPEPGRPTGELPRGTWVLFGPDHVAARLRPSLAGVRLVTVTPGERFAVLGEDAYQVAPDAPAEHGRLLDALAGRGPIGAVLHAWSLSASDGSVAGQLRTGALSVRALLHALAAREGERPPMLVLTARGLWARDGDRVDVAKATLPGLLRTAVAEHMLPLLRQVDLADDDPEAVAAAVRAELAAPAPADLVAYRDGARLAPRLRPVPSTEDAPNLVPGGLYLVTGGLGGIAFEVAQYLLAAYQTPLLLLGRTDVDAAGPDDPRAERLAELRALGEVEYRAVDVADPAALTAAVTDVERRHGPLAGVLHLASADVSGQWTDLERHTVAHASAAEFTTAYRAKVFGTLALAELLETRPDALLVLFSSVNGDFGGSSFGAYSSANGFLTGFADHWGRERGRPVRCLAWSMWTETGMNRRSPAAAAESRGFRPITDASGLESLLAALALDRVHLLIGLDPHNEHIIRELAPEHLRDAEIVLAYTATEPVTAERVRAAATEVSRRAGVPVRFVAVPEIPVRPDGEVDRDALLAAGSGGRGYVEPTTELERRLAELWAEVLGASRVGRDDRFFDLGGSSLRAAQLVARVNAALDTRMLVHQLYEHPTVGELAAVLEKETNRKDIGS